MLTLRKSGDRGYADHGWLQSHHSFSFADYYDAAHMGWGNLRVINEDYVAPGSGFGKHGHRDMEIVTYVTDGLLAHQDSMGNGTDIPPGDVQRMSAGTGVQHSEFNGKRGRLRLIASEAGAEDSVTIHADASIYAGLFDAGESATLPLNPARKAYVHVARGTLTVNGQRLQKGDAAMLADESNLTLADGQDAEVLVFDLAP